MKALPSLVRFLTATLLIVLLPALSAQQVAPLDHQAKKIRKALAKYPDGAYLRITMKDGKDLFGTLGKRTDTSFQFTNVNGGGPVELSYLGIDRVSSGNTVIEAASNTGQRRHHPSRTVALVLLAGIILIPIIIVATVRD